MAKHRAKFGWPPVSDIAAVYSKAKAGKCFSIHPHILTIIHWSLWRLTNLAKTRRKSVDRTTA